MRPAVLRSLSSLGLAVLVGLISVAPATAAELGNVFTVANYPVDADGKDAVTAKRAAIAAGQKAAFKSLLRRIVPVTRYSQIKSLPNVRAGDLIDGVGVARERNSRTRYEASLNFAFNPQAVRDLLNRAGIAFVDAQAKSTTVVLAYREPKMVSGAVPSEYAGKRAGNLWRSLWRDLDLKNALTPVKLERLKPQIHADTIKMVIDRTGSGLRIMAGEYGVPRIVLALVEPDLSTKKLLLWLAGQDAVGAFSIKRTLPFEPEDFSYTMELAAVISLGILEGRWKAVTPPANAAVATTSANASAPAAGSARMNILVEFATISDWARIRGALGRIPGVQSVDLNGLSTRQAQITVVYPRGAESLRAALAASGLSLEPQGDGWVLR